MALSQEDAFLHSQTGASLMGCHCLVIFIPAVFKRNNRQNTAGIIGEIHAVIESKIGGSCK